MKKQARKSFRPPSAMKGIGYLDFFGNFLGGFFGGIYLEELFWRNILGGFFLGGFFLADFLGGIFWEELLSRN
jgi:hypothetical protein